MTCYVSSGTLNSTNSTQLCVRLLSLSACVFVLTFNDCATLPLDQYEYSNLAQLFYSQPCGSLDIARDISGNI